VSSRFTRQPQYPAQIDWNHQLARGLVYAVNFAGGLTPVNLARGRVGASTITGTVTAGTGAFGRAIVGANGVLSVTDPTDGILVASGGVTHVAVANITALDNPWGGIFAVSDGATNGAFALQRNSSSDALNCYRDNSLAASFAIGSASAIVAAGPKVIVVTSAGRVPGADHNLFINRTKYSQPSTGSTGTIAGAGCSMRFFGERAATTSFGADGQYFAHYVFSRVLTDEEALELVENPWQIFRTPSDREYSFASGGAATREVTASGGLDLGGAAAQARVTSRAATGGLDLGGAAAQARVIARAPAGGIDLGGIAEALRTRAYLPAGGVDLGGTAPQTREAARTASGGIDLGGLAVATRQRLHVASGGLDFGGSAPVQTGSGLTVVASGGLDLGGSAPVTLLRAYVAAGGLDFGGAATLARTRVVVGLGGLELGGAAILGEVPPAGEPRPPIVTSLTHTAELTLQAAGSLHLVQPTQGPPEVAFDVTVELTRPAITVRQQVVTRQT
jgi:hypothetical protein